MKRLLLATVLPALLIMTACGPKPEKSESVLDSPDYHVSQGLRHLQADRLDDAEAAFDRALGLDPDYGPAFSGIALVLAERGNFEDAEDLADEGVSKAKKNPFTWAALGRVRSLMTEPGDEAGGADKAFEKAIERDSQYDLAWYWWGLSKERAWEFGAAENRFAQAIDIRGPWADEADDAYQEVQKILRAAPGSKVGMRIAQVDKLDRADLAALFMEELKLAEVMQREAQRTFDNEFVPPEDPTKLPEDEPDPSDSVPDDIKGHWAQRWIMETIDLGVMEIAPDRKFYPEHVVTRGEFALLLQNILATVLHDENLPTKYIGEDPRFADMRSGTATYNAAALAVDRGFMDADMTGEFNPAEAVSGAEALLSIRRFQNHLEYDF